MKRLEDLDLNLLILLHWLLEEANVSRAAKRVGISQPAASRGLQRLRTMFSDELLIRSGRGYVLSRQASSMKPDLATAIATLRRVARVETRFEPATSHETITIAANDYLTSLCARCWVETIAPTAPFMSSSWRPLDASVLDDLATGQVDFVAIPDAARSNMSDVALMQDLVIKPLLNDRFVAFAHKAHPVLSKTPVTAEVLTAHDSVLVSPTGSGPALLDAAFEARGLKRRIAHRTSLFTLAADLALDANMVTILPQRFASNRPEGGIAPLAFDGGSLNSSLVWHASRTSDPGHKWIRQSLFRYFDS